jgi:hypothetical protein
MVGHKKRIKPPALQRLNELRQVLQVEISIRPGPRVTPPACVNADGTHESAEMQMFWQIFGLLSERLTSPIS